MERHVTEALLEQRNWGQYQPLVDRFFSWEYCGIWQQEAAALNYDLLYDSFVHGQGHIERTMLHGAMCAMAEGLNAADTLLLLRACALHDISRVNDQPDDTHGCRAAARLPEVSGLQGQDLLLVQGAVDAHSRHDSQLTETLQVYGAADAGRAKQLALLLKDADGLDRVRIWDLDPRYLRCSSSRERAGFAKELYIRYQDRVGQPRVPGFVRSWKHLDENGDPV